MNKCADHEPLTYCANCDEEVDEYGNTENQFDYCCFPDCGCDGARNCMAREPNYGAASLNIEQRSEGDE